MRVIHPLRQFREQHEPPLTQEQLGKVLGYTAVTISRWENAERLPRRKDWARISRLTGIPISRLIGIDPDGELATAEAAE